MSVLEDVQFVSQLTTDIARAVGAALWVHGLVEKRRDRPVRQNARMGTSRRSSRSSARSRFSSFNWDAWSITAAAAIVLLLIGAAWAGYVAATRPDPAPLAMGNPVEVAPLNPEIAFNADLASVRPALAGPDPYVITVLGDSTGNEPTEWVYLMGEKIAADFDRPVLVHNWDTNANDYTWQTPIGEGRPGALVEIWNGSASGKTPQYSGLNFDKMAPAQPDLVFVNHAHNGATPDQLMNGLAGLNVRISKAWDNNPVVAYIAQNPRIDAEGELQNQRVDAARTVASRVGAPVIDVQGAFLAAGDLAPLLQPDKFHPSPAGSGIWAGTVERALLL